MTCRSERGATSVEYGLIAGLIAAVVFAAVMAVGQTSRVSWHDSCDKITSRMDAGRCP